MADRALIDAMVAAGASAQDAAAQIDAVFAAMPVALKAGKAVGIPGVCRLAAPSKPAWLPFPPKKKAVLQRKVAMRDAAILERGEPYDV